MSQEEKKQTAPETEAAAEKPETPAQEGKLYTAPASAAEREPLGSRYLLCAAPILVHGDIEGGVLLHGTLREAAPNAETVRAAATAAEFLARWMEE